MLKDNMSKKLEPKVFRTRLMGGNSHYNGKTISITIPHDYAEYYDLSKPTNVLLIHRKRDLTPQTRGANIIDR